MDCIVSGQLLLPDGPRRVRLAPGTLEIRGERITSISPDLHPRPDFGGPACLITPGFVDTHVHLPQFDSIGIDGLELLTWLDRVIFPAEAKWADADYAGQMATRVAKELLSFGTTAVAAFATSHHQAARNAIAALAKAGLRGHVGQVLMDRNAPSELLVPTRESIDSAASLAPQGRIAPAVTPRFAITCSDALLQASGELARKTGWLVQTHLAETRRELEVIADLFPGQRYTEVYRKAGLLTDRTLLAHGIWLDPQDHADIAAAGSTLAHCPTANRFLDAGEMNRAQALAAQVQVCLGTDVAGGPDRSMVRVARAMIETAKQLRRANPTAPVPTAAECWWHITQGNAQALHIAGTGVLAQNSWADLVVIDPASTPAGAHWQESRDPLATALYAWDDRWLCATFAAGTLVFQN